MMMTSSRKLLHWKQFRNYLLPTRFLSITGQETIYTSAKVGNSERPSPSSKLNLFQRIASVAHELKPPVNNKLLLEDFLKVMIVGGPNQRSDYHIEMGEELFYQIQGHMHLDIIDPITQQSRRIQINEGEMFLLPRGIPHSPQRYENTIGLVIERERGLREMDCLRWYYPSSSSKTCSILISPERSKVWYEEYFHCKNLGTQLKQVIQRFQEFTATYEEAQKNNTSSHVSYFTNKDQLSDQDPYIQALNDLPYSKQIQNQPLQGIHLPSFFQNKLSEELEVHPPRKHSSFHIFDSEFVVIAFTGRRLLEEERLSSTFTHKFNLPDNCTSKEFLFFQYSGKSQIKKIISSHSVNNFRSHDKDPSSRLLDDSWSLEQGDMVIIQDEENNLASLQFTFSHPDDLLWCIYNTASL